MGREGTIFDASTIRARPFQGAILGGIQRLLPCRGLRLAFALVLFAWPAAAGSQTEEPIRDTFGEVGLLEMPSAHMAPDGELAFTVGDVGKYQRYSLEFQALPWLETSFRYSHAPHWLGAPVYYDRSFGLKMRLFQEGNEMPDVSLGIRDLLGTGVYSSEYLALSKHIGPFDLTGGLGWGRLADNSVTDNPLGLAFGSFKKRARTSALTGTFDFGQYFHGAKMGAFGGITWQTPIDGLSVIAEYSSDEYKTESRFRGGLKTRSPVNLGIAYRPLDSLGISAGWMYGTTYGLTISVSGDPTTTYPSVARIGPPIPPPAIRSDDQQRDALTIMHQRNEAKSITNAGGPWVSVPTEAERARQNLLQAYFAETRGIRNVEIQDRAIVIDTRLRDDVQSQCASYARIASLEGSSVSTLAVTDLQDPSGTVVFCSVKAQANAEQPSPLPRRNDSPFTSGRLDPAIETRIRAQLVKQMIQLDAISAGANEMWVYYENPKYYDDAEAIGRIVRVLMANAPAGIEIFDIVASPEGIPAQQVTIYRSALERALASDVPRADVGEAVSLATAPLDNPVLDRQSGKLYPSLGWSLDPKLTQRVFDPNQPIQFLIFADLIAYLELGPGFSVEAQATAPIWTDYNYNGVAGSVLPHVRTDVLQYLRKGKYGISDLQVAYHTRLSRDLYAGVRAGYLEDMYAGAGAELMWRPEGSRLAFGADLYQVWKRDFNRLFGLQNYKTLTGHATVYYHSPWYGLNFAVHAGRYLAGDYGATFEISRQFITGVEIGAWATFTNVPFKRFGEGSFDKGIIVHIPLQWGLPIYSRSSYDLRLASLTRDGGQRLFGDDSLYYTTRATSYGELAEHLDDVVDP